MVAVDADVPTEADVPDDEDAAELLVLPAADALAPIEPDDDAAVELSNELPSETFTASPFEAIVVSPARLAVCIAAPNESAEEVAGAAPEFVAADVGDDTPDVGDEVDVAAVGTVTDTEACDGL